MKDVLVVVAFFVWVAAIAVQMIAWWRDERFWRTAASGLSEADFRLAASLAVYANALVAQVEKDAMRLADKYDVEQRTVLLWLKDEVMFGGRSYEGAVEYTEIQLKAGAVIEMQYATGELIDG